MAYHNVAILLNFIFITRIAQPTANHRSVAARHSIPLTNSRAIYASTLYHREFAKLTCLYEKLDTTGNISIPTSPSY